jgi:hypothetical protein
MRPSPLVCDEIPRGISLDVCLSVLAMKNEKTQLARKKDIVDARKTPPQRRSTTSHACFLRNSTPTTDDLRLSFCVLLLSLSLVRVVDDVVGIWFVLESNERHKNKFERKKERKISPFVQKKGSKDREPTEDRQTNLSLISRKGYIHIFYHRTQARRTKRTTTNNATERIRLANFEAKQGDRSSLIDGRQS